MSRSHGCEWCSLSAKALRAEIDLYTRLISEADSKAEALGGSIRCAPENRAEVDRLESEAAGHDQDRYLMRECLKARD